MPRRITIVPILASLVGLAPVAAFDVSGVEIHGFISQGYLHSSDNNWVANTSDGSAEFNEVGINFQTELTDTLRGGLQLFSYDLGPTGNNAVSVDWAYLDWRPNQAFGLRAGRVKLGVGLYNEYQDVDAVRPTILLPQSVYYQMIFREASVAANGIQAYGNLDLGSGGDLDYQAFVGASSLDTDSSIGRAIANDLDRLDSISSERTYQGALMWNAPVDGLRIGISALQLEEVVFHGGIEASALDPSLPPGILLDARYRLPDFRILVASAEYTADRLTLAAEYRMVDFDERFTVHADTNGDFVPDSWVSAYSGETESDGYYLQASYLFNDAFTGTTYLSIWNNDREDRHSDNARQSQIDWCLAGRYDITYAWNVKAEYHYMDGNALLYSMDNPDGFEDQWHLIALKTTVSF